MVFSFKRRRGLSNVVTSAILLTSVAVIGSAMIGWSNSNLKVFETSLSNTTAANTNQLNENLNIENVVFCKNCGTSASDNVINVTLTNMGTLPINATQIQINTTAIGSFYYSTSSPYSSSVCVQINTISHTGSSNGPSTCLPAEIMPNHSYQISATLPSSSSTLKPTWQSKVPDSVTITTGRNTVFTTQVSPP